MSDKLTHFIISKLTILKRDLSLSWRQAAKEDNFQTETMWVHIPTAVSLYSFACGVISFDEGQYFPRMLIDSPCTCMHLLQANIWDILSFLLTVNFQRWLPLLNLNLFYLIVVPHMNHLRFIEGSFVNIQLWVDFCNLWLDIMRWRICICKCLFGNSTKHIFSRPQSCSSNLHCLKYRVNFLFGGQNI